MGKRTRQLHRWVAILFTALVLAVTVVVASGSEPAEWVYLSPLPPLLVLMVSGLYLFAQPYLAARRRRAA